MNVSCTMQDANDLYAVGDRAIKDIKDNVIAYWKTAKSGRKVRSTSTYFRHSYQHFTFLADFIKPAFSGYRIFLGDSKRDFDKVKIRPTGSQDNLHQAPFLFNRFRTLTLMPGISYGASSPRLASSIPTAISRRSSSWRWRCTSLDSPSQRYISQRSFVERRFVADLTSATVLIFAKDNPRIAAFQWKTAGRK